MADTRRIMGPEDVSWAIDRLAAEIVERNHGAGEVALVGIHTGGVPLAARIRECIRQREGLEPPLGTLDITLYRDDWSLVAQQPQVRKTELDFAVEERVVVLVDDVIFTGRTIRAALDAIIDFGRPRVIQLACLVDRGGRELPIQPDFVGQAYQARDDERVDVVAPEDPDRAEVLLTPMSASA